MTTTGEKMTLLAEIIRVSARGATETEISEELSLPSAQAMAYIRFLRAKKLLVIVDQRDYFPSEKGLAYLATYDDAADLVDIDGPDAFYPEARPAGLRGVHWKKSELEARMREIIDR